MFSISGKKVEIVVLKCPYMNLNNPMALDLFSKMMLLKYNGYGNRHLKGSLPLDTSDFVADHPLICVRDEMHGLIPISGSKVITYSTCKFFNLEFAMESCLKKIKSDIHLKKLNDIIENSQKHHRIIAYHGGYTIDPLIVTSANDREIVREIFMGVTASYFLDNNITELLGLGVPKFKTQNFFYQWGYERCSIDSKELDCFPLYFLPDTEGVMMHLKNFSDYILILSEKYKSLWQSKIEIGQNTHTIVNKKTG